MNASPKARRKQMEQQQQQLINKGFNVCGLLFLLLCVPANVLKRNIKSVIMNLHSYL